MVPPHGVRSSGHATPASVPSPSPAAVSGSNAGGLSHAGTSRQGGADIAVLSTARAGGGAGMAARTAAPSRTTLPFGSPRVAQPSVLTTPGAHRRSYAAGGAPATGGAVTAARTSNNALTPTLPPVPPTSTAGSAARVRSLMPSASLNAGQSRTSTAEHPIPQRTAPVLGRAATLTRASGSGATAAAALALSATAGHGATSTTSPTSRAAAAGAASTATSAAAAGPGSVARSSQHADTTSPAPQPDSGGNGGVGLVSGAVSGLGGVTVPAGALIRTTSISQRPSTSGLPPPATTAQPQPASLLFPVALSGSAGAMLTLEAGLQVDATSPAHPVPTGGTLHTAATASGELALARGSTPVPASSPHTAATALTPSAPGTTASNTARLLRVPSGSRAAVAPAALIPTITSTPHHGATAGNAGAAHATVGHGSVFNQEPSISDVSSRIRGITGAPTGSGMRMAASSSITHAAAAPPQPMQQHARLGLSLQSSSGHGSNLSSPARVGASAPSVASGRTAPRVAAALGLDGSRTSGAGAAGTGGVSGLLPYSRTPAQLEVRQGSADSSSSGGGGGVMTGASSSGLWVPRLAAATTHSETASSPSPPAPHTTTSTGTAGAMGGAAAAQSATQPNTISTGTGSSLSVNTGASGSGPSTTSMLRGLQPFPDTSVRASTLDRYMATGQPGYRSALDELSGARDSNDDSMHDDGPGRGSGARGTPSSRVRDFMQWRRDLAVGTAGGAGPHAGGAAGLLTRVGAGSGSSSSSGPYGSSSSGPLGAGRVEGGYSWEVRAGAAGPYAPPAMHGPREVTASMSSGSGAGAGLGAGASPSGVSLPGSAAYQDRFRRQLAARDEARDSLLSALTRSRGEVASTLRAREEALAAEEDRQLQLAISLSLGTSDSAGAAGSIRPAHTSGANPTRLQHTTTAANATVPGMAPAVPPPRSSPPITITPTPLAASSSAAASAPVRSASTASVPGGGASGSGWSVATAPRPPMSLAEFLLHAITGGRGLGTGVSLNFPGGAGSQGDAVGEDEGGSGLPALSRRPQDLGALSSLAASGAGSSGGGSAGSVDLTPGALSEPALGLLGLGGAFGAPGGERRGALLIRTGGDGPGRSWFLGLPTPGGGIMPIRLGGGGALQLGDYADLDGMPYERLVQLEDVKVTTPQEVLATLRVTPWYAAAVQRPISKATAGGVRSDGFTDGTCVVCLLDYEDGDQVLHLPCKHAFHEACAKEWLGQYSKLCPTCRAAVCS